MVNSQTVDPKPDFHADFAKYESCWPPPFFCCSLVSHSNNSVKNPLTFSSIARASSSDSRWALRGCQTSRVRSIRLSSAFFIRNHRTLQRRPELRRVRDRSAAADDRRVQSLLKTSLGEDCFVKESGHRDRVPGFQSQARRLLLGLAQGGLGLGSNYARPVVAAVRRENLDSVYGDLFWLRGRRPM
jgi:hypothetical protein